MRLSYLSVAVLLAVSFLTLSGSDCAESNLVKRKRGVGESGSSSSEGAPPRKKPALDGQGGLGEIPGDSFKKLELEAKKSLTKNFSAREWNELLERCWVKDADYENNIGIASYITLNIKEKQPARLEEGLFEMLEEALKSELEYLFAALSDLAYVPRTAKAMPLLELGLEVFPNLRNGILPTIYQLGYRTTKWHLGNSEEDVKLLKYLIQKRHIEREPIAGHLAEIMALYPPKVLTFLAAKQLFTVEDVCTMELYRKVCGLGGRGYLEWVKHKCDLRPDWGCFDAAVSGGHENVVDFIANELGMTMQPSQKAVNRAAANGKLALLVNRCIEWGLFPDRAGAKEAARNGHVDVLDWLTRCGVYPDQEGANWAAGNGQLGVLKWLATRGIYPGQDGADRAAINGRLGVLKWMAERGIYPTQDGANWAAENGHLEVLKWMAERGVYPTQDGANWATENGHLEVLKWMATLEPAERRVYPNRYGADGAAINSHLGVLKWLATHGIYPDQDGANSAAENGHLEVLKWMAERGAYPDQRGANTAAENGHLEVLKWMAERGVYPNQDGANEAAINGHLEVLKWMAMREPEGLRVYPNQDGANWAAENGHLEVLKWLTTHEIYADQCGTNKAAENGHLEVLKWMAAVEPEWRRVYPGESGADGAAENGHLEVLKWMAERGVYPSQSGADSAARYRRLEVLEWLRERGVIED